MESYQFTKGAELLYIKPENVIPRDVRYTNQSNMVLALKQAKMSAMREHGAPYPHYCRLLTKEPTAHENSLFREQLGKQFIHTHREKLEAHLCIQKSPWKTSDTETQLGLASYCDSSESAFLKSPFHLVF